ncbi:ORF 73 ECLF1 [hydrothermal vent metagenome]|uniref:ORF 73 ECLF1 n=1 Tax=hydrothermal vent metagenome TaxID=652676 RepID=A0A1W1EA21_9ZZZZ
MELPALKLPQIQLPFDIPVLAHPPVDHFVIAIPILVLIIELINLVAKKRAIGTISFVLLTIGMVAAVAAYLTGTVDGKEAFDALTQAGQSELKAHKLLGTYLMLASAVVVLFKMLSAIVKKGIIKALYLLILVVFVAGILKQGHDGGELVYKYGANVERVADLDSDLFDAKEELDDANEALNELKEKMTSVTQQATQKVEAAKATATEAVDKAVKKGVEVMDNVKESTSEAVDAVKEKAAEITQEAPAPQIEKVTPPAPQPIPVKTH